MNLEAMIRREEDEHERASLASEIDALSDLLERTCEAAGVPDLDPADLPALVRQMYQSDRAERRPHPLRAQAELRFLRAVKRAPWRSPVGVAKSVAASLGGEVTALTVARWGSKLQGVPTMLERLACAKVRKLVTVRAITREELLTRSRLTPERLDGALKALTAAGAIEARQVGRVVRWGRT